MRIGQSSSVVSAVYAILFDILLPILLAWLVRILLSSRNLKLIYDDRKRFSLGPTRLAIFVHQGLSPIATGRFIASITTIIILLTMVGAFSINGISRRERIPQKFRLLVDTASPEEVIDFKRHLSEDGSLVSGTVLLLRQSSFASFGNKRLTYAKVNDIRDINTVKWPSSMTMYNSTCVTEKNGFVERTVMTDALAEEYLSTEGCSLHIKPANYSLLSEAMSNLTGNCDLEIIETWCSHFQQLSCVTLLKHPNGYTTSHQNIWGSHDKLRNTLHTVDNFVIQNRVISRKLTSQQMRAMSYLLDVGFRIEERQATDMVSLTIRTDTHVLVYGDEIKETDVDTTLLSMTLGPAISFTVLIAIHAIVGWERHIRRSSRQNYNRFHSTADLLAYADL